MHALQLTARGEEKADKLPRELDERMANAIIFLSTAEKEEEKLRAKLKNWDKARYSSR